MKKRQTALIFDMDGLLIDSEPLWQQAETEVFKTIGIALTPAMTAETMGLRTDEVIQYWAAKFPEISLNQEEIAEQIICRMQELIITCGQAMPGVKEAVKLCQAMELPLALATSSAMTLVTSVLQTLDLKDVFEVIASAEEEAYGKPHPAVYLTASDRLGIAAMNCIAVEDSLNGVISAKAAKMKCIAIPSLENREEQRFALADVTLNSLEELTQPKLEALLQL